MELLKDVTGKAGELYAMRFVCTSWKGAVDCTVLGLKIGANGPPLPLNGPTRFPGLMSLSLGGYPGSGYPPRYPSKVHFSAGVDTLQSFTAADPRPVWQQNLCGG